MKPSKNEIELRLIGSLLSDWCKQRCETDDQFLYHAGDDSTHRVIRFTTEKLQSLLTLPKTQKGQWNNGHAVMYELHNASDGVTLTCTASSVGLGKQERQRLRALAAACGAAENKNTYQLAQWPLSPEAEHINALTDVLEQLLMFEVAWFESELGIWKEQTGHKIRSFPQDESILVSKDDLPDEIYMEGAQKTILLNRYERNPKARARCIAVHGSACKVCGFDFGIAFGEEFSGKIEVHHIKPISEIGKEYVVDPAKDLVPVCPNCHMMLHSKKNGVYSVEELKRLRGVDNTVI